MNAGRLSSPLFQSTLTDLRKWVIIMANMKIVIKNPDVTVGWPIRNVAREIGEKIQGDFEAAITKFYIGYSPKLYERTYSLYEGAIGVGGRGKYINKVGKYAFECGIEVGAEFYSGNPYVKNPPHGRDMSPDIVFPSAFDKGIHGFTTYTIGAVHKNQVKGDKYWKMPRASAPRKTTPPKTLLNMSFKQVNNQEYIYGKVFEAFDAAGAFLDIE